MKLSSRHLLALSLASATTLMSGCTEDEAGITQVPELEVKPPVTQPEPTPDPAPEEPAEVIMDEFDLTEVDYTPATKPFSLHSMMANHAVFQQGEAIRIFGQAEPNTLIMVKLQNNKQLGQTQRQYTVVPSSGEWVIELEPLTASFDDYTLTVADDSDLLSDETQRHTRRLDNLLIGEVWVMSGQSNMEFPVHLMEGGEALMDDADTYGDPYIRLYHQKVSDGNYAFPHEPQYDVREGRWVVADSGANIRDNSAIGFSFAKDLQARFTQLGKQVPVAIINAHRGGSKIQPWLPREVLNDDGPMESYVESLSNEWNPEQRFQVEYDAANWNSYGWDNYTQPSALYNQKLKPLSQFNIKGAVWYQGESDPVYTPNLHLVKALIDSWSADFDHTSERVDPLQFALIQLAPYDGQDPFNGQAAKVYSGFADNRRAQVEIASSKEYRDIVRTIPIYDIGLEWEMSRDLYEYANPIHPYKKAPVGQRVAQVIMSSVYTEGEAKNQEVTSLVESVSYESGNITITFSNVGNGLLLFKNEAQGLLTFELKDFIGTPIPVAATIISTNQVQVSSAKLEEMGIDLDNIVSINYSHTSRNENSNLANSHLIPVTPFVIETGNSGGTVKALTLFSDAFTHWQFPSAANGVTSELITEEGRGQIAAVTFVGNNTTAPLEGQFAANLSQYAGGTIEFDLKVDANPSGKVFVALSCGYPCGTADYEITSQLTDATGWNRISIDLDTITATPKQSGVPFNLNSVTQPLIILPAWGEQQKGTIFKLDNIRYLPKAL